MSRFAVAALMVGCAVLAAVALWSGVAGAGRDVLAAAWVLPGLIAVHLVQLSLGGLSWRALLGPRRITIGRAWRLRWMREGIDSLLPVAQVGGELVSVRLLARGGMPPAFAGAATTLDLMTEAATLPVVVLAGSLVFWAGGGDVGVLRWVWAGVALVAVGVAGFALLERLGGVRVLERAWARFAPPSFRLDGLSAAVAALLHDRRAMATAFGLHVAAWSLGAGEVWLALKALGHPVSAADAFVIEAFGAGARGAGFAVPASLGVQEGGFVLAAGLFGIAPEAALALAALKRLREVLVGVAGLWFWRVAERSGRRPAVSP